MNVLKQEQRQGFFASLFARIARRVIKVYRTIEIKLQMSGKNREYS